MDYKKFFWATKEKVALALALFVLANVFFFPLVQLVNLPDNMFPCDPEIYFIPIWKLFEPLGLMFGTCAYTLNWQFEIVYLGFSYLAACIFFYMKKGGN